MALDELHPTAQAALWTGLNTGHFQIVTDRDGSKSDAEFSKFAGDLDHSEASFLGNPNDDAANFVVGPGPTNGGFRLGGRFYGNTALKSPVRGNRDQVFDGWTQHFAELEQLPFFVRFANEPPRRLSRRVRQ